MSGRTIIRADLHADRYEKDDVLSLIDEQIHKGDLVIIAGDLCDNLRKKAKRFVPPLVEAAGENNVIIIPGNHDFYGYSLDREDRMREVVEGLGAVWGQMHEEIRGDNRYLCTTLWTNMRFGGADTRVNGAVAKRMMNDYRYIRVEGGGYRKAGPLDTMREHNRQINWLRDRLMQPFSGQTVVVTHHAPLVQAAGDFYGSPDNDARCAYASDLTTLINETQPDEWFFGHTHQGFHEVLGNCVVRNVSVGYPDQRKTAQNDIFLGHSF